MTTFRCSSARGNRTNKSTAFSPNGTKLEIQSMIHDHMMTHYRRIENVKPLIDNKPPKCITKFIKFQDRKVYKRKESERRGAKDALRRSQTSTPIHKNDNYFQSSRVGYHYDEGYDDKYFLDSQRASAGLPLNTEDRNIKSFSRPRSTRPTSYKCPSHIQIRRPVSAKHKVEMYGPEGVQPVTIQGSVFNNGDCSRNTANTTNSFTDATNRVWSNGVVSYKQPNYSASLRLDFSAMSLDEQLNHARIVGRLQNKDMSPYDLKRIQKQEELIAEEQIYLQFIEEVTSDILTRGIFSDRVLNQVFDVHIQRRKGQLNEGRMRAMIDELKEDLNVTDQMEAVSTNVFDGSTKIADQMEAGSNDVLVGSNAFTDQTSLKAGDQFPN